MCVTSWNEIDPHQVIYKNATGETCSNFTHLICFYNSQKKKKRKKADKARRLAQ